jgi:hypothetical protein
MKHMDCPLCFIPDVVSTCIILHNYASCQKDAFDRSWIEKAKKKLQNRLFRGELEKKSKLLGEKTSFTKIRGKIDTHPNMAILGRRM